MMYKPQIERQLVEDGPTRRRRDVPLLRDAAPDDIAGVDRLDVRLVLLAHGRTIPVRADEDIAMFVTCWIV